MKQRESDLGEGDGTVGTDSPREGRETEDQQLDLSLAGRKGGTLLRHPGAQTRFYYSGTLHRGAGCE